MMGMMEKTYQSKKFRKEVPAILLMVAFVGLNSWVAFTKSVRDGLLLLSLSIIGFVWMWVIAGRVAKSIVIQEMQIRVTLSNGKVRFFECSAFKAIKSIQRVGFEESVVTFTDGNVLKFTSHFYEYEELKKFFDSLSGR